MKKRSVFIAILIVFTMPFVVGAATYSIDWAGLTHSSYEGGSTAQSLCVDILDTETGTYMTNPAVITSISLLDPNGSAVTVTVQSESPAYQYLPISYADMYGNLWNVGTPSSSGDINFDVTGTLGAGDYQLALEMENGQTLNQTLTFVDTVTLPLVPAASIHLNKDASGNVTGTWNAPNFENASSVGCVARLYLNVFDSSSGTLTGLCRVQVPVNMGYAFIPAGTVSQLESLGDLFRVRVQVRSTDSNTSYRTNSNSLEITGSLDNTNIAGTLPDTVQTYVMLTDNSVAPTLPPASYTQVYGTSEANTIKVSTSARVVCDSFDGPNVIYIQEASSAFTVSASGATVVLTSAEGTRIEIAAKPTAQILCFSNGSSELAIAGTSISLGSQIVTGSAAVVTPVDTTLTSAGMF